MQCFDNGVFYTVTVLRREVEAFNRRWPCSQLPDRAISFQFDKRNGDLVDITPYAISAQVDGPEGVVLSQDAQAYGKRKLGL